MSWTLRVTKYDDEGEFTTVFGQLVFGGVYVGGGDGVGAYDFATANTAQLPAFLTGQTALHATRAAFEYSINLEGGFNGVLAGNLVGTVAGGTPVNMKIKIWNTTTGNELGAGAYPASLTGNPFHTAMFKFKKNI